MPALLYGEQPLTPMSDIDDNDNNDPFFAAATTTPTPLLLRFNEMALPLVQEATRTHNDYNTLLNIICTAAAGDAAARGVRKHLLQYIANTCTDNPDRYQQWLGMGLFYALSAVLQQSYECLATVKAVCACLTKIMETNRGCRAAARQADVHGQLTLVLVSIRLDEAGADLICGLIGELLKNQSTDLIWHSHAEGATKGMVVNFSCTYPRLLLCRELLRTCSACRFVLRTPDRAVFVITQLQKQIEVGTDSELRHLAVESLCCLLDCDVRTRLYIDNPALFCRGMLVQLTVPATRVTTLKVLRSLLGCGVHTFPNQVKETKVSTRLEQHRAIEEVWLPHLTCIADTFLYSSISSSNSSSNTCQQTHVLATAVLEALAQHQIFSFATVCALADTFLAALTVLTTARSFEQCFAVLRALARIQLNANNNGCSGALHVNAAAFIKAVTAVRLLNSVRFDHYRCDRSIVSAAAMPDASASCPICLSPLSGSSGGGGGGGGVTQTHCQHKMHHLCLLQWETSSSNSSSSKSTCPVCRSPGIDIIDLILPSGTQFATRRQHLREADFSL